MYQRRMLPLGFQAVPMPPQLPRAAGGVTLPSASFAPIPPPGPGRASEVMSNLERGLGLAQKLQALWGQLPDARQPSPAASPIYDGFLMRHMPSPLVLPLGAWQSPLLIDHGPAEALANASGFTFGGGALPWLGGY